MCQLLGPHFSRWLVIQQLLTCCCKPQGTTEDRTGRNDSKGKGVPDPAKGQEGRRWGLTLRRGSHRPAVWTGWRLRCSSTRTQLTQSTCVPGGTLGTILACGFIAFHFRGDRGSEGLPGAGQGGAESEAASRGAGGCGVRPRRPRVLVNCRLCLHRTRRTASGLRVS